METATMLSGREWQGAWQEDGAEHMDLRTLKDELRGLRSPGGEPRGPRDSSPAQEAATLRQSSRAQGVPAVSPRGASGAGGGAPEPRWEDALSSSSSTAKPRARARRPSLERKRPGLEESAEGVTDKERIDVEREGEAPRDQEGGSRLGVEELKKKPISRMVSDAEALQWAVSSMDKSLRKMQTKKVDGQGVPHLGDEIAQRSELLQRRRKGDLSPLAVQRHRSPGHSRHSSVEEQTLANTALRDRSPQIAPRGRTPASPSGVHAGEEAYSGWDSLAGEESWQGGGAQGEGGGKLLVQRGRTPRAEGGLASEASAFRHGSASSEHGAKAFPRPGLAHEQGTSPQGLGSPGYAKKPPLSRLVSLPKSSSCDEFRHAKGREGGEEGQSTSCYGGGHRQPSPLGKGRGGEDVGEGSHFSLLGSEFRSESPSCQRGGAPRPKLPRPERSSSHLPGVAAKSNAGDSPLSSSNNHPYGFKDRSPTDEKQQHHHHQRSSSDVVGPSEVEYERKSQGSPGPPGSLLKHREESNSRSSSPALSSTYPCSGTHSTELSPRKGEDLARSASKGHGKDQGKLGPSQLGHSLVTSPMHQHRKSPLAASPLSCSIPLSASEAPSSSSCHGPSRLGVAIQTSSSYQDSGGFVHSQSPQAAAIDSSLRQARSRSSASSPVVPSSPVAGSFEDRAFPRPPPPQKQPPPSPPLAKSASVDQPKKSPKQPQTGAIPGVLPKGHGIPASPKEEMRQRLVRDYRGSGALGPIDVVKGRLRKDPRGSGGFNVRPGAQGSPPVLGLGLLKKWQGLQEWGEMGGTKRREAKEDGTSGAVAGSRVGPSAEGGGSAVEGDGLPDRTQQTCSGSNGAQGAKKVPSDKALRIGGSGSEPEALRQFVPSLRQDSPSPKGSLAYGEIGHLDGYDVTSRKDLLKLLDAESADGLGRNSSLKGTLHLKAPKVHSAARLGLPKLRDFSDGSDANRASSGHGERTGPSGTKKKAPHGKHRLAGGSAGGGFDYSIGAPPVHQPKGLNLRDFVLGKPYEDMQACFALHKKELGSGQFGVIRKCKEIATGLTYACKTINKECIQCAEDAEDIRREVSCLMMLRQHPTVVTLRRTFEDAENIHIVMDLMKGGDLLDRITAKGQLAEPDCAQICKSLVEALLHCSCIGIVHRDVKPENVLLKSFDSDCNIKLVDFGVATFFEPDKPITEVIGTPEYMAPEVLKQCYGPEADIWSAGVVLYVALSGIPPFWASSRHTMAECILNKEVSFKSTKWANVSEECKDIIRRMLDKNPKTRISATEVLSHVWIQKHTS